MKAKEIRFIDNKFKYMFELPSGYGYEAILDMAQLVIDRYFQGKIVSFKESILAGWREKDYTLLLKLHGNKLNRCRVLKKEQGAVFLKGRSTVLDDEIEIAWFNQTNIIGVAASYEDDNHKEMIEKMMDVIVQKLYSNSSLVL